MSHSVLLARPATVSYEKLSSALQKKADRAFEQIGENPRRHPNIKPLKGAMAGLWRYRIGDHRIVYRIEDNNANVVVLVIEHRRDVYG